MNRYIIFLILILPLLFSSVDDGASKAKQNVVAEINTINQTEDESIKKMPPSLQMYFYIKKYAKKYDVPLTVCFSVAKLETGYSNPTNYKYIHNRTSCASALGPMQLLYSTALSMSDNKKITREQVKNNVELNVRLSIKYLRYLYNIYPNWRIVLGCYNTGRPIVNSYALNAKI